MGLLSGLGKILGANPAWSAAWMVGDHLLDRKAQKHFENRQDTAIQRRVADARAAGVHPLYALGGSGSPSQQFSPGGAGEKILTRATSDNIEADTALKLARAAEIRKGLQDANSKQDDMYTKPVDGQMVQPGGHVKTVAPSKKTIQDNLKGLHIITPDGRKIKIDKSTPVSVIEETLGQIAAEVFGTWKAWKMLRAEEKKMMLNYIKMRKTDNIRLGKKPSMKRHNTGMRP
jgi:hypothetical protein